MWPAGVAARGGTRPPPMSSPLAAFPAAAEPTPSRAPRRALALRELLWAGALLLLLVTALYPDVVFAGRSLVFSDFVNPLEPPISAESYGPHPVSGEEWTSRNLQQSPNLHDPASAFWQWEPQGEFLRHALRRGELPWW